MPALQKRHLPQSHLSIFCKELLPETSGKRGVLCKDFLPQREKVTKALHTHKYIRKYKHNGRWIYIYKVTKERNGTKEIEHHHTTWNHVEHDHHNAPGEFRLDGEKGRKEGAEPHSVTEHKGKDAPQSATDVSSHSLPKHPNHSDTEPNQTTIENFLGSDDRTDLEVGERSEFTQNHTYVAHGADGYVYRHEGPPPSAVKFPNMQTVTDNSPLEKEIELSILFGDPAVGIGPSVKDCRIGEGENNYLAKEWCEGTLKDIPEGSTERKKALGEAFSKLRKLHLMGYAYMDLKDNNIFLHSEKGVLLGDFGRCIKGASLAYFEATTSNHYAKELVAMMGPSAHHVFEQARKATERTRIERIKEKSTLDAQDYKDFVVMFYNNLEQGLRESKRGG